MLNINLVDYLVFLIKFNNLVDPEAKTIIFFEELGAYIAKVKC